MTHLNELTYLSIIIKTELQRLLGTAKDKDRQDLIRDAIQSLSGHRNSLTQSFNQSSANGTSSVSSFFFILSVS